MLSQSQATTMLKAMTAATVDPTLSDDEIGVLLLRAAVMDTAGLAPSDDDWTPTYSPVFLNASAAEGWRWKAGRITDRKTGNKGDDSFAPEQQRQHMIDLAADYQKRVQGSERTFVRDSARDAATISGAVFN